eukprot:290724-Amphidinium_carterae.1
MGLLVVSTTTAAKGTECVHPNANSHLATSKQSWDWHILGESAPSAKHAVEVTTLVSHSESKLDFVQQKLRQHLLLLQALFPQILKLRLDACSQFLFLLDVLEVMTTYCATFGTKGKGNGSIDVLLKRINHSLAEGSNIHLVLLVCLEQ